MQQQATVSVPIARGEGAARALRLLTVEQGAFGVCLLVALGLRLAGLSLLPLTPLEAANAWPAWLTAAAPAGLTGEMLAPLWPASPLLHTLQAALFWLAGGSDAQARGWPALAGAGLVLVLWPLRPLLNRRAPVALVAALWVAIDPWLVALSRLADGALLSLTLAMLVLAGIYRLAEGPDSQRRAWLWGTGVAAGLLLVSGPLAWCFVPVIVAWVWLNRQVWARPIPVARVAGSAGVAGVLAATGWLAWPQGLQMLGRSLTAWFGLWTGAGLVPWEAASYPVAWLPVRLLADQPLLLLAGVAGLLGLTLDFSSAPGSAARAWPRFLWLWLLWATFLWLLPGRHPLLLAVWAPPLLLAGAHGLAALVEGVPRDLDWREAWVVLGTLAVLAGSGLFWWVALTFGREFEPVMAQATLAIALLTVLVLVAYGVWTDPRHARWLAAAFVCTLLLCWTVAATWHLGYRERLGTLDGFLATVSHADLRQLVADVETISAQRTGHAHDLPVLLQVSRRQATPQGEARADFLPLLGWYLREMRNLSWRELAGPGSFLDAAVAAGEPLPLVITGTTGWEPGSSDLAGAGELEYVGSRYTLTVTWLPTELLATPVEAPGADPAGGWLGLRARWREQIQPFLRWMLYRMVPPGGGLPGAREGVILWATRE